MDVTFVLEESGVTATVEVPCEADVAAAKEVACTALAVSPASVEMRIGTQVLEGTCRLQDTAFDAGVQVVLACRFADIKCPAEYTATRAVNLSLSRCGTRCVYCSRNGHVGGFDTETFDTVFSFKVDNEVYGRLPSRSARHAATWRVGKVFSRLRFRVGRWSAKSTAPRTQCLRMAVLLSHRAKTASLCMTKT